MVYKINGIKLNRDAHQQALQGQTLSFIEESEAGDLAFFDNTEGKITHVGLLLENRTTSMPPAPLESIELTSPVYSILKPKATQATLYQKDDIKPPLGGFCALIGFSYF